MRLFRTLVPVLFVLLTGGIPGNAQSPVAASAAAEMGPMQTGLPVRNEPPRTLRAQSHVYIAFAVAWLLLFGYALWLGRRFARLERELDRLGQDPPSA